MSKKKETEKKQEAQEHQTGEARQVDPSENGQPNVVDEKAEEQEDKSQKQEELDPMDELKHQLDEAKDKYIRLSAEFDNFRKRTQREKMDLIRYGSEDVMKALLPVIDDFDRAIKSTHDSTDIEAVKQGLALIQNKFMEFLKTNGVKEIEAIGLDLDTDVHEAITKFPVDDKKLKGKIVDVVEKGYALNDKVIRFSKVVVGE